MRKKGMPEINSVLEMLRYLMVKHMVHIVTTTIYIVNNYAYKIFDFVFIILSLTHSWSRALLEKLPIVQLLKKFPAFYGT
jgi:hypothetical protein